MNIHLFKRPKSMSNGKLVHYWTLKWYDNGGRRRYESIGRVGDMTRSDALSIQREKLVAMGSGTVSRDKPTKMTLGQFLEHDRDAIKSDVKQATIVTHNGVSSHAVAVIDDIELAKVDWTDVAKLKNWLGTEHVLNGRNYRRAARPLSVRQS